MAYEDPKKSGNRTLDEVQLEDMEAHVYNIEHLLLVEIDATDNAKDLL
jgi:hypothetical protein